MKTLRILIVEDEPLVAMDLEAMVAKIVTATVVVEPSVAATKQVLHEAVDFAFLDVEVTNGKTFEIAHRRSNARVCLLPLFRARDKKSCLLTCAARLSFQSLFTRLRLSARCKLCRRPTFVCSVQLGPPVLLGVAISLATEISQHRCRLRSSPWIRGALHGGLIGLMSVRSACSAPSMFPFGPIGKKLRPGLLGFLSTE
jgi:hypothetical protein